MPAKKLPDSDDKRLLALQTFLDQEELNGDAPVLLPIDLREMQHFFRSFEGACTCARQAEDAEAATAESYDRLFANLRLYLSHFIQVLYLAAVRREVRPENLTLYGLEYAEPFQLPDLSSEEDILAWADRVIAGEAQRISRGESAIYNPPIAKVKVHYDLFCETAHSLKIYRQNLLRSQESLETFRDKADILIWAAWTKLEFAAAELPLPLRDKKYMDYGLQFHPNEGEQLNVFS
jgi:hypothetical protein